MSKYRTLDAPWEDVELIDPLNDPTGTQQTLCTHTIYYNSNPIQIKYYASKLNDSPHFVLKILAKILVEGTIEYYYNDNDFGHKYCRKIWFKENVLHRENHPAEIFLMNNSISTAVWWNLGNRIKTLSKFGENDYRLFTYNNKPEEYPAVENLTNVENIISEFINKE